MLKATPSVANRGPPMAKEQPQPNEEIVKPQADSSERMNDEPRLRKKRLGIRSANKEI